MTLKSSPIIFPTERKCEVCGQIYKPIRVKQKFCSTQCHNKHHNTLRLGKMSDIKSVLDILIKNHQILEDFFRQGKTKVSYSELQKAGFRTEYITHFNNAERKNYVFNFYYRPIGEQVEIFKVTKK